MTDAPGVPKTIYSLWFQGREAAPELVRFNFARWEELNPDYQVKILHERDVFELLDGVPLPISEMPIQALSDIVRARLLRDDGGIWVDASLLPVQPLSHWLDAAITEGGFFAFERPWWDRPISSWFLAATPRNLVLRELWVEIERFWSKPRRLKKGIPANPVASVAPNAGGNSDRYPFFWFHYLFQYLLESNPEVASTWDRCARMEAALPCRLQALFVPSWWRYLLRLRTPNPSVADIRLAATVAPVQKLNWRVAYPMDLLAASLS